MKSPFTTPKKSEYIRTSPSPGDRALLEQYRQLHEQGEPSLGIAPEDTLPGKSLPPPLRHNRRLIGLLGGATLLDYGSGKGLQYRAWRIADGGSGLDVEYPDIRSYWGVGSVHCDDPAYVVFAQLPQAKADGVICTDVLEHCPEEDIPWIVAELFSYARLFVFANVACFPAQKRLPSGDNAHCTIRPPKWWRELVQRCAASYPDVVYEFRLAYVKSAVGKQKRMEAVLSSEAPGEVG